MYGDVSCPAPAQTGAIRRANAGAVRLLELFAEELPPQPWTVQKLMRALQTSFEDWDAAQGYAAAFFDAAPASSLPLGNGASAAAGLPAVFRFRLRCGPRRAHLASLATQLAVASNAAEAGLRLELFQPLDDVTEALLRGEEQRG